MKKFFTSLLCCALAITSANAQTTKLINPFVVAPGTFTIQSGAPGAGVRLQGTWDFSFATVIGIGGSTAPTTTNLLSGTGGGGIADSGIQPSDVARRTLPNVFANVNTLPGVRFGVKTVTADYTPSTVDTEIRVDASSGPVSVYLPFALGTGQFYHITKGDLTGNAVSVVAKAPGGPSLPDLIDGQSQFALVTQFADVTVMDVSIHVWDRFNTPNPSDPQFNNFARLDVNNAFTGQNFFSDMQGFTGLQFGADTVYTNYTLADTDFSIMADATTKSDPLVVYLPQATGSGQMYRVKKFDFTDQVVTVQAFSSGATRDVIDGVVSLNFVDQGAGALLQDIAPGYWDNIGTVIIPQVISDVSWWYRPDITTDAGVATMPTAGYPIGSRLDVVYPTGAREYLIQTGTADPSDPGHVAPADYSPGNIVHWEQKL